MSRRSDATRRQIGPGLLATGLGIAVEVSDLQGTLVEVAAWSAVGLGLLLILIGGLRLRALGRCSKKPRRSKRGARRSLSTELRRVGNDILDFVSAREAGAPTVPPATTMLRHPLKASRERQAQLAAVHDYDDDTLSLYDQRFARRVLRMVHVLIDERLIGRNEENQLVTPGSVADVEAVGRRLLALSRPSARSRRRSAA